MGSIAVYMSSSGIWGVGSGTCTELCYLLAGSWHKGGPFDLSRQLHVGSPDVSTFMDSSESTLAWQLGVRHINFIAFIDCIQADVI